MKKNGKKYLPTCFPTYLRHYKILLHLETEVKVISKVTERSKIDKRNTILLLKYLKLY